MENLTADTTVATAKSEFLLTTDMYAMNNNGSLINFNLMFNNYSAVSESTVIISDVDAGDTVLIDKKEGFLLGIDIDRDTTLNGRFLKIQATLKAGTIDTFPEELDVVLSLYGGKAPQEFRVKPAAFTKAEDVFNINFTIFLFHV